MKRPSILLVDKEPKNLVILENNFIEANFLVDKVTSDYEALKILTSKSYDIILSEVSGPSIDGFHILEQLQRDSTKADIPVVFLTQKSDIWNKVKSFKLGAKDYIVKPVHVREIVARVNMLVRRLEKQGAEETLAKKKFAGRIEDFCLSDLIETFGVERKTGILTLVNSNGTAGKIYFKKGSVINAEQSGVKGEDAIFKMMAWNKGRFSMLFTSVEEDDAIMISNMGLLLEGAKRMEQRDELLKHIPSLDAVVVTTSNFKKILDQKSLSQDLAEFLKLFDGERTITRIIDDSDEDELTILSRIAKLSNLGFLYVLRDFGTSTSGTDKDEMDLVSSIELEEETKSIFDEDTTESDDLWDDPHIMDEDTFDEIEKENNKSESFSLEEEITTPAAPVGDLEIDDEAASEENEPKFTVTEQVNEIQSARIYDIDDPFADFSEDDEQDQIEESDEITGPLFQNEEENSIDKLFEISADDVEIELDKQESIENPLHDEKNDDTAMESEATDFDIMEIDEKNDEPTNFAELFESDKSESNNLEDIESIIEDDVDDVEFDSFLPEEPSTVPERQDVFDEKINGEPDTVGPDVDNKDTIEERPKSEFGIIADEQIIEQSQIPVHDITSSPSIVEEATSVEQQPAQAVEPEEVDADLELEIKERHDKAKGHILVLGTGEEHRKQFINELVGKYHTVTKVGTSGVSDIFHGTAEFKGNHYLNLISFSIKTEFTPLVEYFVPKTLAYILIVEEVMPDWAYITYLLNVMRNNLKKPCNIIFTNNNLTESQIMSKLRLKANEQISFCDHFDEKESKKIIFSLFVK